jgi:putrescine---pyruvate transaminase
MSDLGAKELAREDVDHIIHPITNLREHAKTGPKIFVKGEGVMLTDIDGRRYIDGIAGLFNVAVGHGRKELGEAAAAQMSTLAYLNSFNGFSHRPAIELAAKLASLTEGDLNHFFFTSGGAEATDSVIKFARYYWKLRGEKDKVKIVTRRYAYHGITIGAMSATGIEAYQNMFGPLAPGFVHIAAPYCYRCEFGKSYPGCNLECALALEETIKAEGPETVAAFMAEPVHGIGGVIVPPPEYFPKIREICDKYDVLLIADEVITGFCRTGRYWGMQNWGVKPDMFIFAKAVTSGYIARGGVGLSDRIRDQLVSGP